MTALWRPIAPWRDRSTAWAWFASIVVFFGAGHAHGWLHGARGGIAALLAWSIARELAPRRTVAAAIAPLLAIPYAIPALTDLVACLGALLVARVTLRGASRRLTIVDHGVLVALTGWLATRPEGLPVALVLAAVAFADDRRLRSRVAGVSMLAVAIAVGALEGTLTARPGWGDHAVAAQVVLAIALVAAALLLAWPSPPRLRTARFAVVACVLAAVAWTGTDGAFALSSACAAIVASAIGGFGASAILEAPGEHRSTRKDAT